MTDERSSVLHARRLYERAAGETTLRANLAVDDFEGARLMYDRKKAAARIREAAKRYAS